MPATARQTRKQIRQSIGLQLGAVNLDAGSITHAPSETAPSAAKLIDETLFFGSDNEHRGKWLFATDSNSSTYVRRVSGSSPDERSLSVSVPFDSAPSTAWTYELWDEEVSPVLVHQFINDALNEVTRKGSITVEADSFHTGGRINAYGIDSAWTGVKEIEWRYSVFGKSLVTFDEAASSLTANTTVELDSADYREGRASARLTVAAGESSGTGIAASSFSATDIRGYDRVEFWFKTSGAITSSNYTLQIMQGSSAQVAISLPASSGDSWTFHTADISSPENNSSVTAVQVSTGASDGGAGTLWVDDVQVTRKLSGQFNSVPRDFWTLSQQNRQVRINDDIRVSYANLRITGVRKPNQLSTDSDICEVDPQYVVNSVMAKVLRTTADRRGQNVDASFEQAERHEQLAQAMRLRWSMPVNVRWLED